MKMLYPAVLQTEPEGGFTVTFPDLPNCVTYGESLQHALEMGREALGLYLVSLEEHKNQIPSASDIETIIEQSNFLVVPIVVEVNQYRRNKSVNKMVTLPQWLIEAGEQANVNFSGVLQEALKAKLGYA
jgi:predicted RNase H-like HicB family nuclease